ncbi:MAG: O-methyltransferase [Opitutales bacterium]
MEPRCLPPLKEIYPYLLAHSEPEPEIFRRLHDETQPIPQRGMQIGWDQGLFLGMLVKLMNARRVLEIGTFTGYSALAMARALPPEGKLVACDVSEEWTAIASRYWAEAGVDDHIVLRLGPAQETLRQMRASGEPAFDLAFIDADKPAYPEYFEACLDLVRPGGAILADNTLQGGRIHQTDDTRGSVEVMRAFNRRLQAEPRVETVVLPLGDGVTLCRVREQYCSPSARSVGVA